MNNVTFGECLKRLLSALDVSMNRLSKAINVDNSLVNRWIHGERIPPYGTSYIDNIADYLSKNVHNTFQINRLNEALQNECKYINDADNIEEKIKKVLYESQGYSIENKSKEKKKIKNKAIKMNNTKLTNVSQVNFENENKIEISRNNIPDFNRTVELSSNDKIIFGTENIFSAWIYLLDNALKQDCIDNKIIHLTFNNSRVDIINNNDKLIVLRDHFSKAINKGWKVLILVKLDNNIGRTVNFIKFVWPLIETEGLILYNYKKYGIADAEKETYVMPGVGALSVFTDNENSGIDCAFYLRSKQAVKVLEDYFNLLLKNHTRPLLKKYNRDSYIEYCSLLIEAAENIGDHMLYKSTFDTLMLPEDLYKKLLKKNMLSSGEIKKSFGYFKKQESAFKKNIQYYNYKEIYPADVINNLISTHQFHLYYYSGVKLIKLEIGDIIELLKNIIDIIKTYANYSIAFIHKKFDKSKENDFCCTIKERKAIFFEEYNLLDNVLEVRLSIEEPIFVKAAEEYFKNTWDHIVPGYKEKAEIIQLLQRHIDVLKKSLQK